jgi:F-type H+-transporting ATPase subunit a
MTIASRLVAFLFVLGFLVAPLWASEESSPHAKENTATHEAASHEGGHGHKALRHDANDIYKEGTREPDAGKLFNNLKDHATEDTYELHVAGAHVALPIIFTDDHGFHFYSGIDALDESGEYRLKNAEQYAKERSKSQFFWVAPWERVDGSPMGFTLDLSLTGKRFFMVLALILLVLMVSTAGKRAKKTNVPKGVHNLVESFVVYVRDEIVYPNVDRKWADKYMPYFLTSFFFIFTLNLLGLVPLAMTATSAISVTLGLAVCTFVLTQIAGIRAMGIKEYLKHFTGGLLDMELPLVMKILLVVIMVPIEFIGLFTKPFALMVRLFANMTAGHIVIGSLIGLAMLFQSVIAGFAVSVPFALFIYMLELLVAFLQAYVFTMLSAVFIGMMAHEHHEEHHSEGATEAAPAH